MKDIKFSINKAISDYLKKMNISQYELANKTGISQPNINRLLNSSDIKVSQLFKITKALELPVTYFFDGKEHINNEKIEGYKKRIEVLEESLRDKRSIIIEKERLEVERVKKTLQNILDNEYKSLSKEDKKKAYEIVITEAKNATEGKSFFYDLNQRSEIIELIKNDLINPNLFLEKDISITTTSNKDDITKSEDNLLKDRKHRKFKDK